MGEEFSTNSMFQYNRFRKLRFAFTLYAVILLIVLFAASYFFIFRRLELAFLEPFKEFITHVSYHIKEGTLLGVLYVALFGGLFFVTIPMEVMFITFLRAGTNPFFLVALYLVGLCASFTANYYLGGKLDKLTKKVITPEKFYKIKGVLNRYGTWAVFVINAVPFLPSQPLSAILGVFRYNKIKFYVFFLAGQLIKYAAIAAIYIYILGLPV